MEHNSKPKHLDTIIVHGEAVVTRRRIAEKASHDLISILSDSIQRGKRLPRLWFEQPASSRRAGGGSADEPLQKG